MSEVSRAAKTFTPKQGQYLAFIHAYTRLHRRPPAEADMQQYFRVSPPSVHQMVLTQLAQSGGELGSRFVAVGESNQGLERVRGLDFGV
jgi:hypothetical protein